MSRPVQEQCPTVKSPASSISPVQEASPKDELKESLHYPVQERDPTDSSDVSSSRPVQEECPTDKSHVSSTSPVQEESPMDKSNASLPYSVPEESFSRKLDGAVNGFHTEELCTSRQSMSNQTRTDDDLSLARQLNLSGPHNRPLAGARCGSSVEPSGSEESTRKAQHSREPGILDGTLHAGAGANGNESMTTARNCEVSFAGNHNGDNPVGASRDNLSSATQSSADGSSPTIQIEDDDPKNDPNGDKRCDGGCRFM